MRVLIADDQRGVSAALAALLKNSHHEVVDVVGSGIDAIRSFDRNRPDLVLMDYQMPRLNGATACRQILSRHPAARIVILSGLVDHSWLESSGAVASLQKPFNLAEFEAVLQSLEPMPATVAAGEGVEAAAPAEAA